MIVGLFINPTKNTQRVELQEAKPVTSSQLAHNCQPQNEVISGHRPRFPDHLSPRNQIRFETQEIIRLGSEIKFTIAPSIH
jgi:hypothetical protein